MATKIPTKKDLPDISRIASSFARQKRTNFSNLSKKLGKHTDYVRYHLSSRNLPPALLVALSQLLETNLFEPYIYLLPEHLRGTHGERKLKKQLEQKQSELTALQQELERVKAERDKYWDGLVGK